MLIELKVSLNLISIGITKMMDLSTLSQITKAESRSITAENPTGEKAGGARARTGFAELQSSELGEGWKVSPAIFLKPHSTTVLADIKDMGVIRSQGLLDIYLEI